MATISDVAKLSGISVSTVSRVINDNPHVSPEKRQKVLEARAAWICTNAGSQTDERLWCAEYSRCDT